MMMALTPRNISRLYQWVYFAPHHTYLCLSSICGLGATHSSHVALELSA